jgi:hypothetical protein
LLLLTPAYGRTLAFGKIIRGPGFFWNFSLLMGALPFGISCIVFSLFGG